MLGLAIAGTVASIGGAIMKGQQQSAALRQQADVEKQTGNFNADLTREQGRRRIASQRVAMLASGTTLEGSPTDVLAQSAADVEMDALAAKYGNTTRAELLRQRAGQVQTGSYFEAGQALLSGASSWGGTAATKLFGGTAEAGAGAAAGASPLGPAIVAGLA
jgi:hypothetical protein